MPDTFAPDCAPDYIPILLEKVTRASGVQVQSCLDTAACWAAYEVIASRGWRHVRIYRYSDHVQIVLEKPTGGTASGVMGTISEALCVAIVKACWKDGSLPYFD